MFHAEVLVAWNWAKGTLLSGISYSLGWLDNEPAYISSELLNVEDKFTKVFMCTEHNAGQAFSFQASFSAVTSTPD